MPREATGGAAGSWVPALWLRSPWVPRNRRAAGTVLSMRGGRGKMKGLLIVGLLIVGVVALAGCTFPAGAVIAPVMMTKSPVAVGDPSVGTSKTGKAEVEGIILLAKGDASISAAMSQGKITRIHHVDSEELNILGIYCRRTIFVYGE